MTFVKYCGITNYVDAKFALDLGVNALGFNFCKSSKRYIDPLDAKTIVRRLPATLWNVGVFVNSSKEEIDMIARTVSLDTIQLHGDESEEFCKNWNELKVIKALRMGLGGANFQHCLKYEKVSDYLLLDVFVEKKQGLVEYGGTGKEIREEFLKEINEDLFKKIFLSGGLNPDNVKSKIEKYHPFAVDVASGIEESPGKKCKAKMRDFIIACRQ